MVTNRLSSLPLKLELEILALVLEKEIGIADHGEYLDIVIGELKAASKGYNGCRKTVNVRSVKKDDLDMAVKKKMERLHTHCRRFPANSPLIPQGNVYRV
jgi:hypothetical protein